MSRDGANIEGNIPAAQQASILVVDDNPLIVDVLKGLLASQNYRVFTSRNGQEAIELLRSKSVDVIICDIMMPKMGGYELHDVVRSHPDCAHIPFIFLTALDDKREVEMGKEAGADDYICKPFEPRELLAVVKGKVNRAKSLKNMSEQRYDNYRRRVIHTLSHEFRTPLVAINTGMELLMEQGKALGDKKAQNLLDAVRRGGLRLERLVNDFMVLQQIEAGVARKAFECRAITISIAELFAKYNRGKGEDHIRSGAEISTIDRSEGAKIKVVENHLIDCLDRLVSNAIKFSQGTRKVEVEAYTLGAEVFIDVKDRGIGLDPDRLDEAIGLFGQIDRERLEQQGGGLGLPIASRYVGINEGRLEFEPRDGGGSILSIVLPRFD